MSQITNDTEFKQVLQGFDETQQRIVAAKFVEHILPLSNDQRLAQVIKVAMDSNASQDELSNALRSARAATFDSHTRCGAECDWTEQAGYFVARAAVAAVSPQAHTKSGNPAWQAALSCRMAQTSVEIDNDSDEIPSHSENEWQYSILSDYLGSL